jgi:hypothetical protein
MLRLVVLLWMAGFLLFTTFITFIFFGSPSVAVKLALFDLKSTNGFVVGNCAVGGKMKYKYVVANRDYISKESGPCKQPIPDQKKLLIYYVESEPDVSWVGNPKSDVLSVLVVSAFMSAFAVGYFLVRYRR